MKPYTWKEISKAKEAERKLIVETYGLLGAVAIELAGAMTLQDTPTRMGCAVNEFLRSTHSTFKGLCPSKCALSKKECDYDKGKKNLIKWYAKLYKQVHGKKK